MIIGDNEEISQNINDFNGRSTQSNSGHGIFFLDANRKEKLQFRRLCLRKSRFSREDTLHFHRCPPRKRNYLLYRWKLIVLNARALYSLKELSIKMVHKLEESRQARPWSYRKPNVTQSIPSRRRHRRRHGTSHVRRALLPASRRNSWTYEEVLQTCLCLVSTTEAIRLLPEAKNSIESLRIPGSR